MPTLKRQKADGTWEYIQLTGEDQTRFDTHIANTTNPHSVTKAQVGLGNVDDIKQASKVDFDNHILNTTNPHSVTASQVGAIPATEKGQPNGVATLDANGNVVGVDAPVDYGRYQSDSLITNAVFSNSILKNGSPSLDGGKFMTTSQTDSSSGQAVYGNFGKGQRFDSTFTANIIGVPWFEFYVQKVGAPPSLHLRLVNITKATQSSISYVSGDLPTGLIWVRAFFPDVVITPGDVIEIRADCNGSGDSANKFDFRTSNALDLVANTHGISTGDNWATTTADTWDSTFTLHAEYRSLGGTVTKTVSTNDIERWGNVEFSTTNPTNTTIEVDILSSTNTVLKANVASMVDISDIDPVTHPSLKVRFTLSRTSETVTTPSFKLNGVTWKGRPNTKYQSGSYLDNTTKMHSYTSYIYKKIIPLNFVPTYARLRVYSYSDSTGSTAPMKGYIEITKDTKLQYSFGTANDLSMQYINDINVQWQGTSNWAILDDVIIDGTDLILVYRTTSSSAGITLLTKVYWEAIG